MKLVLVLLFAACAAFAVIADTSEAALEAAMKKVMPAQGALRKAIEAKDVEAVKKEAATLEAVFATSEAFFKERKIEDGTNWSAQAKTGAAQIAKLAAAGEWDKVPDAQKQVGSTCMACHTAHREKLPEGGYKIK